MQWGAVTTTLASRDLGSSITVSAGVDPGIANALLMLILVDRQEATHRVLVTRQ